MYYKAHKPFLFQLPLGVKKLLRKISTNRKRLKFIAQKGLSKTFVKYFNIPKTLYQLFLPSLCNYILCYMLLEYGQRILEIQKTKNFL